MRYDEMKGKDEQETEMKCKMAGMRSQNSADDKVRN